MENTTTVRMSMTVNVKDVSNKSSCVGFVGQGTWFDGKSFIVTQYKANPTCWYFFVYDVFAPEENYFDGVGSFGNEIWHLNPDNGEMCGKTYLYSSMLDKMYEPYAITPVVESPSFLFEMR